MSQIIRTITARDLLAGDLGAHRALAVDPQQPAPEPPPAVPPPRAVYSRRDREQAWQRRRADLEDLDDLLNRVDARAHKLARRTAAILHSETNRDQPDRRNP